MKIKIPEGPFEPTWESLKNYKIPDWYKDAKFGIFIHFGVYSVPAFGNEWYPRNMYIKGTPEFEHHIKTYGEHKKFGYKDFIPLFKAEKFDPYEWVDIFKRAGAKYIVPVAEHHDGFAMYDCSYTKWCATKMGPKRDIIGELAKAVRENYLTFGISYHRAEHWWFFNEGMKFDSDVREREYFDLYGPAQPETMQPTEEFLEDWYLRLTEIIDKYQPQLIYFDWWIEQPSFEPYLKRIFAYYYNKAYQWEKSVVINYKLNAVPRECAVFDVERGKLSDIDPIYWQTDTSISRLSWGYIEKDIYKSSKELIWELVDIVSKNGNLLLNIGPQADGTIPEPVKKILLEIGEWLLKNGEAIYGAKPWKIYGEGPTRSAGGSFSEKEITYTGKDFRFTTKEDILYAILMNKPEKDEVFIKSLSTELTLYQKDVLKVELLEKKLEVPFERNEKGLIIKVPEHDKLNYPITFKITSK
ncbi:MAG: alpha-L-fucosidase [Dictyoglomaceae bacterium]|nr:alpha-L-fucosidase [Dictyoglomaceae bacterium]